MAECSTRRWVGPMFAAGVLAAVLAAAPALADVTVERTTRSSGIAGIGAGDTTTVEKFSGVRKRDVTTMRMSGFLGKMAGDLGGDTITDVAKDAIWRLDHKKKTYAESRITPPPPKKEDTSTRTEERPESGGKDAEEKPTHRVVRNEVTVTEPGDNKRIGAYDCTHYVITWILEVEEIETKERTESTMVADLWNTPETDEIRALQSQEREFAQAYARKKGWDITEQAAQKVGLGMVGALLAGSTESQRQGALEVAEKMKKIKGYSIGSGIKWTVKSTGGTAQQSGQAEGVPDLSKGLGGLMSALGKKAAKSAGESAAGGSGGAKTVFDTYTEISRISTSSLPDADFAPPAGYKKVD